MFAVSPNLSSEIKTFGIFITKTCSCNLQRILSEAKIENFIGKVLIFVIPLLKTLIVGTLIVGTRYNCLVEAVLKSSDNKCFRAKLRKIGIPLYTPVLL